MATYSNNVTTKVGININQRGFNGVEFSYTVPSGSYLVLSQYYIYNGGGAAILTINYPTTALSETYTTDGMYDLTPNRTFGPGTVLSSATGASSFVEINGYLITNTP